MTCSRGHESSTADYCDVCGVPMSGGPAGSGSAEAGGVHPEPEAEVAAPCPVCGTARVGRFCEEDGYDFLLAPPVPATPPTSASASPASASPASASPASASPTAIPAQRGWQLVVDADPDYFDLVRSFGGTDAASLAFPRFVVPRRFTLEPRQLLVGRRSRSRGVRPDIDLTGPPEDPGVSHLHALLVPQPDGWAVVDLGSANGSYLNDPSTPPIVADTPVPLGDGDRVYLGAWTRLTILADR